MPFVPNTPEALIQRSDSKDPNTTCRGVTGSGRPCRRPNARADTPQPKARSSKKDRLRVLDDPSDPDAYCWQHKDQAASSASPSPGPQASNTPIFESRTSIDSLTARLGLMNTSQPDKPSRPQQSSAQQSYNNGGGSEPQKPLKEWSFCCFRIPLYFDDPSEPPRPQATPVQKPTTAGKPNRLSANNYLSPNSSGRPHRPSNSSNSSPTPSHISNASQHASWIPPDAPGETANKLIAEMAKPISKQDEEGWIYIFWLTPESQTSEPQTANARSLLEPTARSLDRSLDSSNFLSRPGGNERRPSDILASFAAAANSVGSWGNPTNTRSRDISRSSSGGGSEKPTILLKIGRATNVMRRMNEWKRQCGYDLSLIRFYPYVQTGSGVEPHKMPHSHKVERLIHIELRGLGLGVSDRGECPACGRNHKEWFEVEATQEGVLRVDEAIRRWVDWDEAQKTA